VKDLRTEDDTACLGTYSYVMQQIHLEAEQSKSLAESSMLHEIMEALMRELRIRSISHDDLERLESGLYATLTGAGVNLTPLVKEKA